MTTTPTPEQAAGPMTDDRMMRVIINACDSLNITRVHELGGKTRTICDEAGLLEIGRAVEAALSAPLAAEPAEVAAWRINVREGTDLRPHWTYYDTVRPDIGDPPRFTAQPLYTSPPPQPVPADDVLEALDLRPDQFRTEGGAVNRQKLRAAILHPADYLPPEHWLLAAPVAQGEVSEGWKVVPIEPTPEMIRAAVKEREGQAVYKHMSSGGLATLEAEAKADYVAMLDVALNPPLSADQRSREVCEPLTEATRGKLPIPPAPADALEVTYVEGWNAACDRLFGFAPADQRAGEPLSLRSIDRLITELDATLAETESEADAFLLIARAVEREHGIGATPPAAPAKALTDASIAQAIRIANDPDVKALADDVSHLGRRVYVNDLVWALGVLAASLPTSKEAGNG